MHRLVLSGLLALVALAGTLPATAQVTGLSNWSLYIDPGHSQNENVGVYGYSEAKKVLRVGLFLRDMLLTRTDIESVAISRTTDAQQVSLTQRTDQANALGVDFFHSIHSNAGGPATNNTLMLYGGWRLNGQTIEKTPLGGGRMGDEYVATLTAAMRIPTIGNFADRTFYQGFPDTHANQYPYLFVNRESNMASVLSEGGFHTNPRQNTLNMNAEWKRLEAQAFYWAILDWHGVPRSTHRIATGIVTDVESGIPINGATITISGQTYTTDTYASLFNQYSNDPDELHNGFYYLEDVGAGAQTVTVTAPGYAPFTGTVTVVDTDFSFLDVQLLTTVPPVVTATTPADGTPSYPVTSPLRVTFSRPMDPATTAAAVTLAPTAGGPAVAGTITFEAGNTRLVFTPTEPLAPTTAFTLTISGTATTAQGAAALDGNGDGTGGDAFTLAFTSSFPDAAAPRLRQSSPSVNASDVELRPVITVAFDEPVDPASLTGRVTLERVSDGQPVTGQFRHAFAGLVGAEPDLRSTVSFVPDALLAPDVAYRFAIEPGVTDRYLNATTARYTVPFRTGTTDWVVTPMEPFEGTSIVDNWWLPQQSGSTEGIVTDSTNRSPSPLANLLGGTTSMRIDYGWDQGASTWLLREYLNGGPPRQVSFQAPALLQAYVFGDGNGTLFRFAVDDATGTEVSPWVAVDWFGWRAVTWDPAVDGTGVWIGNGVLEGALRFDSIQLGWDGTSPRFGELYVDDLRVLQRIVVDDEAAPDSGAPLALLPPRPNPTSGEATLPFHLGTAATVTVRVFNALGQEVAVLADAQAFGAGPHEVTLDGRHLAAGVYVVRVQTETDAQTARFVIAR